MAAGHPFARKCEAIIAHLRDILANLRKAKKKIDEKVPEKKPRIVSDFFGLPKLRLLGSHEMEQQGFVTGSNAGLGGDIDNSRPGKKKPRVHSTGDPQRDRLLQRYQDAMEKCRKKNIKDNEAFYRCRARAAKEGLSGKHCQSSFVPMQCPEGVAAREALDAYEKSKGSNSGGGGGGGF